jgi:hypothetical protein
MVRYKVRPEQASLNEELIRGVFEELHELRPDGFSYRVLVLDDGLTYVHIVEHEQGANPLPGLASFKRYTAAVRERCEEQPVFSEAREVGAIVAAGAGGSGAAAA